MALTPKRIESDVLRGLRSGIEADIATGQAVVGLATDSPEQLAKAGQRFQRAGAEFGPPETAPTVHDIGTVGDFADWAQYNLGKLAPMMVPSAAGARIGVTAARATAGKGLKEAAELAAQKQVKTQTDKVVLETAKNRAIAGGTAGAYAGNVGQETGLIGSDIFEETGEIQPGRSLGYGAVAGALDTLTDASILGKVLTPGRLSPAGVLKEAVKSGLREGSTEVAQGVIETAAVQDAKGRGFTDPEALKEIFDPERMTEEFAVGALGGTVLGGGAAAVGGKNASEDGETTEVHGVVPRAGETAEGVSAEKDRQGIHEAETKEANAFLKTRAQLEDIESERATLQQMMPSLTGEEHADAERRLLQLNMTKVQLRVIAPPMASQGEFYSPALEAAKALPQEVGTSEQMYNLLKKQPGVKQEELEDLGVEEFLSTQKHVSKEELAAFIEDGGPTLEFLEQGNTPTNEEIKVRADQLLAKQMDEQDAVDLAEGGEVNPSRKLSDRFPPELIQDARLTARRELHDEKRPAQYEEEALIVPGNYENYREVLVQAPGAKVGEIASEHFYAKNVLAHARITDRKTTEDKKILFLEELQSDVHQKGRKEGYGPPRYGYAAADGEITGDFASQEEAKQAATDAGIKAPKVTTLSSSPAPDLPFKKSWPMLTFKRMMKDAVEKGYDEIAWTTGDQQNARYGLSAVTDQVYVKDRTANSVELVVTDRTGNFVDLEPVLGIKEGEDGTFKVSHGALRKEFGDDLATQILSGSGYSEYSTNGATVGGSGMRGFYDQILPAQVGKYVKKFGSKVGKSELQSNDYTIQSKYGKYYITHEPTLRFMGGYYETLDAAEEAHKKFTGQGIHSVQITDAMRDAFLENIPLYSKGNVQKHSVRWANLELQSKLGVNELKKLKAAGMVEVLSPEQFQQVTGHDPVVSRHKGLFRNGKIFLHSGVKHPYAVLIHEGTHSNIIGERDTGLRLLLGDSYLALQKQFSRLVKAGDVDAVVAARRARKARQVAETQQIEESILTEIEMQERLAYYAEIAAEKETPLSRRIIATTKAWVRQTEFGKTISRMGIALDIDGDTMAAMSRLAITRALDVKNIQRRYEIKASKIDVPLSSVDDPIDAPVQVRADVNKKRIVQMLGRQFYGDMPKMPSVLVKEMLQNSADAIKDAIELGEATSGKVDFKLDGRTITVKDDGLGMSLDTFTGPFLTLGSSGKRSSKTTGGYGVAKGVFLFGGERIQVSTVRDGTKIIMDTTGAVLHDSLEDDGPNIPVTVIREIEEPNGTEISVTIPETYYNPDTEKNAEIPMPAYAYQIEQMPAMTHSPLFAPITVTVNDEPTKVGNDFPMDKFGIFNRVTLPGTGYADVFLGKEDNDSLYTNNVRILINGNWQFSERVLKNDFDPSSGILPREVYINIVTDLKPESDLYPITANRQGLRPSFEDGFKKLYEQMQMRYQANESTEHVESFGNLRELESNGAVGKPIDVVPKIPKQEKLDKSLYVDPDDILVIEGDNIYRNQEDYEAGKPMPEVTRETLESTKFNIDDFAIPQETFDPKKILVHDNVQVTMNPEAKKAEAELAEVDARIAGMDADNSSPEVFSRAVNERAQISERRADARDLGDRTMPLSEAAEIVFGERFGKFRNSLGRAFRNLRDMMAHAHPEFLDISAVPVGTSLGYAEGEKTFGMYVYKPFQGMFIDPGYNRNRDNADAIGLDMYYTMVHEIAHHVSQSDYSHGPFATALQEVLAYLDLGFSREVGQVKSQLRQTLRENEDIHQFLNEARSYGNRDSVSNIGKNFIGIDSRGGQAVRGNGDRASEERRAGGLGEGIDGGVETVLGSIDFTDSGSPITGEGLFDAPRTQSWSDAKNSFLYRFQDKFRYLYTKEREIEEKTGERLADNLSGYLAETRYHGAVHHNMDVFHETHRDKILGMMNDNRLTIPEVDKFLLARHAQEANKRLRRINARRFLVMFEKEMLSDKKARVQEAMREIARNSKEAGPFATSQAYLDLLESEMDALAPEPRGIWERFSKKPSGMTDEEAEVTLAGVPEGDARVAIGNAFDEMNRESIKTREAAGLILHEEAVAMLNAYEHWAPLKREGFEDTLGGRGQGSSLGAREFMVRAGSDKPVVNVLANAIVQAETSIIRAEKQKIGEALFNLVRANPEEGFWRVDKEEPRPYLRPDGTIQMYPDMQQEKNEVRVKIDGQMHKIWFDPTNPDAYRIAYAMKNIDNVSGPVVNTLSTVNRWLSFVNTSASPEFALLTNLVRDLQTAQFSLSEDETKNLRGEIMKGYPKAFAGALKYLRGDKTGEWAEWFRDYSEQGGTTGWVQNYESVADVTKNLKRQMSRLKTGTPLNVAHNIVQVIADMNTAVENSVRLSTYKAMVEAGSTKARAAQFAKELTVNFNRKGTYGQTINAFYLFANAGIQGSMKVLRLARYNKKVQAAIGGLMATGFAMSMVNRAIGQGEDDDESAYDSIPDWIKERNMVFMLPDGGYLKVPMPWGFNVFWVLGDQLATGLTGNVPDYTALRGASVVGGAILNAFSPIQGGTWAQAASPTITDPMVMLLENKTFTGAPLKPENNPWQKVPIPEHQLYWKSASGLSVALAKVMSDVTGGDEVEGGYWDWSPETYDLIVDSALGSAGRFATETLNLAASPVLEEAAPKSVRDIPFARKVYGEPNNSVDLQLYKERIEKINIAEEKRKRYGATDETKLLLRMRRSAKASEKRLRQLYKLRKRAKTPEREEELQGRIERIVQQFNDRYRNNFEKQ